MTTSGERRARWASRSNSRRESSSGSPARRGGAAVGVDLEVADHDGVSRAAVGLAGAAEDGSDPGVELGGGVGLDRRSRRRRRRAAGRPRRRRRGPWPRSPARVDTLRTMRSTSAPSRSGSPRSSTTTSGRQSTTTPEGIGAAALGADGVPVVGQRRGRASRGSAGRLRSRAPMPWRLDDTTVAAAADRFVAGLNQGLGRAWVAPGRQRARMGPCAGPSPSSRCGSWPGPSAATVAWLGVSTVSDQLAGSGSHPDPLSAEEVSAELAAGAEHDHDHRGHGPVVHRRRPRPTTRHRRAGGHDDLAPPRR